MKKHRIIDTHKDMPLEMKMMTEGMPYKHILDGGLKVVDADISESEVAVMSAPMTIGISLMLKAMIQKSKGNVRICTDMTKDPGTIIDKEKLCLD